jgi:hypothetical protein
METRIATYRRKAPNGQLDVMPDIPRRPDGDWPPNLKKSWNIDVYRFSKSPSAEPEDALSIDPSFMARHDDHASDSRAATAPRLVSSSKDHKDQPATHSRQDRYRMGKGAPRGA